MPFTASWVTHNKPSDWSDSSADTRNTQDSLFSRWECPHHSHVPLSDDGSLLSPNNPLPSWFYTVISAKSSSPSSLVFIPKQRRPLRLDIQPTHAPIIWLSIPLPLSLHLIFSGSTSRCIPRKGLVLLPCSIRFLPRRLERLSSSFENNIQLCHLHLQSINLGWDDFSLTDSIPISLHYFSSTGCESQFWICILLTILGESSNPLLPAVFSSQTPLCSLPHALLLTPLLPSLAFPFINKQVTFQVYVWMELWLALELANEQAKERHFLTRYWPFISFLSFSLYFELFWALL